MDDLEQEKQPSDIERMMQLQKDYEDKKAQMRSLGSGLDMMTNADRWAGMTGVSGPKSNFQDQLGDAAGSSPLDQNATAVRALGDQAKLKQLQGEQDPNSTVSRASRDLFQKMGGKLDGTESAADLDRLQKLQEIYETHKARQQAHSDAVAARGNDNYQKYVNNVEKQAETLRGDDAAKLASARLAAISSGRALTAKYKGREDEMTQDDMALLAADRVKAVTGGVPGQTEMDHMMPHNLGTKWAATKSFFTGAPEATHSGGWVTSANDDFDAAEKSARAILENRQKQITSNPRLRREDAERISKMAVPPNMFDDTGGGPVVAKTGDAELDALMAEKARRSQTKTKLAR